MSDLEQIRDALESAKTFLGQEILWKESNYVRGHGEKKYSELCVALSIIDRMIETPAPQGWSAIETAPKDGTDILLALWIGHPEHKTSFCWAINGHYKDGGWFSKDPTVGRLNNPTHWQHITAPTPAPQGWKLVPIEPTIDMCFLGGDILSAISENQTTGFCAEKIYKAMLSAAPIGDKNDG